jgi:hypothetical protein
MRDRRRVAFRPWPIMGLLILCWFACWPGEATEQRSRGLTLKMLKNFEYDTGEGTRRIRLKDGVFQSDKPRHDYLYAEFEKAAFGDLNGDGAEDAAVIFWWSGGGTGEFVILAAITNRNGKPRHIDAEIIGDRVRVTSIAIKSGTIVLHLLDHAPGEGLARASLPKALKYRLTGKKLKKIGEEKLPSTTARK